MIGRIVTGTRSGVTRVVAWPSQWRGGVRTAVFGVLGLLLIVALAALAFSYKLYSDDRARSDDRAEALAVATKNVPQLLSYDGASADEQFKTKYGMLTGKFKQDFMDMSQKTIIPLAKEQKVSTTAQITASGVISSDDERVDVLLFVNQSTKHAEGEPALQGSRVKVGMVRSDGAWVIDGLTPV